MRILILRSAPRPAGQAPGGQDACGAGHTREARDADYLQWFTNSYAEKVIGNLIADEDHCVSCGPTDCIGCRKVYDRRYQESIAGIIDLPAVLPYLLEDPGRFIPNDIPPHDILLIINIHEQIMVEAVRRADRWGTRGIVVPIEAANWVHGSARQQAEEAARRCGVEIAFPKPFCAFDPPAGTVLAEFRRRFHIGKPQVDLTIRNGRIEQAHVAVSAPCGATYYVARWLAGRSIDDDLKYQVVAKRLHSFPCTASMEWDDQLGDTIMHVAGQAHYEILAPLGPAADTPVQRTTLVTPLGRTIVKPQPFQENRDTLENAKRAVLSALTPGRPASLEALKTATRLTPASLHTAVLLLKQEGKVTSKGRNILIA